MRRRHNLLEGRLQVRRCGSHLLGCKSCPSVLHPFPGCHLLSPHRPSGTFSPLAPSQWRHSAVSLYSKWPQTSLPHPPLQELSIHVTSQPLGNSFQVSVTLPPCPRSGFCPHHSAKLSLCRWPTSRVSWKPWLFSSTETTEHSLSQPPPSVPLPHKASSRGFPPRTLATPLSVFLSPVLFWSHIFLEYRDSFCHYFTHPFSLRNPITHPFHYLSKPMTYWKPR